MNKIMLITLGVLILTSNIKAQEIGSDILPVKPPPKFLEQLRGPALGDVIEKFEGKGIIFKININQVIISDKVYRLSSAEKFFKKDNAVGLAPIYPERSVVKYKLNQEGKVESLESLGYVDGGGIIDRITSEELVISDRYRRLASDASFQSLECEPISLSSLTQGTLIAYKLNKRGEIDTIWKVKESGGYEQ